MSLDYEQQYYSKDIQYIAGCDEAGPAGERCHGAEAEREGPALEECRPGAAVAGKVHDPVLRTVLVAADCRGLYAVRLGRRDGDYPGKAREKAEDQTARLAGDSRGAAGKAHGGDAPAFI